MTNDAFMAISAFFQLPWKLFTSWHIPGTNFTPASFFMFFLIMRLSLYTVIVPLFTSATSTEALPKNEH